MSKGWGGLVMYENGGSGITLIKGFYVNDT
jgi:hypothetical protein